MSSSNSNKVSFSVQSKSNPKSSRLKSTTTHHELQTTTKQFVTEFDPNETLPPHSKPQSRIIIPRKPDQSHHPSRRMKNLDAALSHSTTATAFEQQTNPDDAHADNISYGLNLRVAANPDSRSEPPVENSGGLLKDVKLDINTLPDDGGFREFDEMPVEEFGAALLGGLGWYKSRGIGKNPKGDIEIKQVEKKSFVSDDVNIATITQKDKDREGEKNVNSNLNREGEKNVNSNSNSKYEDKDRKVKYQESEKRVRVDNRSGESVRRREKREKREERERVGWLRSHIRVRIVSKELKRGRLYLKKGEVVDVVGPNTCDISMDENGELVQGVDQELLETALPKRGGPVLVLYGRHKGVYGNLVERDLDRETGVVRDADTHDLFNVKLEQIAEYIGDPSYIGY